MSEPTVPKSLDDLPSMLASRAVPGLSLAYAVGDGPVVTRTWGTTSIDGGSPVTRETIFQAGSVTKVVTAFAVHRLAAEGRLDLDADVNSIMKSWQLASVWSWTPAVTVRMLLAHIGGVSTAWDSDYSARHTPPALTDELSGRTGSPPIQLEALPGLHWFYSSGGYQVVAQVICDVTGQSYPDAIAELVLGPLGMSDSTAVEPLPTPREPQAARGHRGGSELTGGWRNSGGVGAAGLWTTPTDLVRLARAVNSDAVPALRQGHPVEPRMGLGAMLTVQDDVTWWWHGGSVPGYECLVAGTGPDGFAVAVMTNADGSHGLENDVFKLVAAAHGPGAVELVNLFGEVIETTIAISAGQEEAVGAYRLPNGATVEVTAPMGQFGPEPHLTLPGQLPARMWPGEVHRWWIAGLAGTEIVYEPPGSLMIRQYGTRLRAVRVS